MSYSSNHFVKVTPEDLRSLADDIERHADRDNLAGFAWISFRDKADVVEMLVEQPAADRKVPDPYFRDPIGSFTIFYGTENPG